MTSYWLEHAVVEDVVRHGVRVTHRDGVIATVTPGVSPSSDDRVLLGLAVPGFANAHSHAFHRALRGRTHDGPGDFWSWRQVMYRVAARLDLDLYRRLATAAFAEMVLAGYTVVGEFHYVHHRPDGRPYENANAMGEAIMAAAADAGIRLTLLDVIYLRGGLDQGGRPLPLDDAQRRFGDDGLLQWMARHEQLAPGPRARIGAAVHSVRAVDVRELAPAAAMLRSAPLHAHVSEQPAENQQSLAAYGMTPVAALDAAGLLGSSFTAVHATHLRSSDVGALAASGSTVCFCPTTERDLADGIGAARVLSDAGVPIAIGSDQHVVVDPFEELRALEGHERLSSLQRGRYSPSALLRMGTSNGYDSLGWRGGRIAPGELADFITLDAATPRTAGSDLGALWLSATASDVRTVVVGGDPIVTEGRHRLGDVGALLAETTAEVFA